MHKNVCDRTSASCCLVRPPLRISSIKLPNRGQLVGPGIASMLCARDAAWGHVGTAATSFSSSTHTDDVAFKCCSPTDFFFRNSTICGTFCICALILYLSVWESRLYNSAKCPLAVIRLRLVSFLWFLVSWKCHTLRQYIYTPRVFIPAVCLTNQGSVLHGVAVEPTIHWWVHVRSTAWPQIDRGIALALLLYK